MDPRESNLPKWAQELIADLRRRVQYGNEPVIAEIAKLRPQVETFKARNDGLTELLACAAKGGHVTSIDITNILDGYELELRKHEE